MWIYLVAVESRNSQVSFWQMYCIICSWHKTKVSGNCTLPLYDAYTMYTVGTANNTVYDKSFKALPCYFLFALLMFCVVTSDMKFPRETLIRTKLSFFFFFYWTLQKSEFINPLFFKYNIISLNNVGINFNCWFFYWNT